MAHELEDGATDDSSKTSLNRREYVKFGASVAAVAVGAASGVSVSAGESETTASFTTGFGEYA